MTTLTDLDEVRDELSEAAPRVIIAVEGSELADALRAAGWVARAGWRTTTNDGQSVWRLRFEINCDEA